MNSTSYRRQLLYLALAIIVAVFITSALAPQTSFAQEAGKDQKEEVETQNPIMWFIVTSGFIGFVILCLSIYFVSTVCRLFIELRPQVAAPPELIDECEDLLQKRQFKEIYAAVKE